MQIIKATNYREQVSALLEAEKLPVNDLPDTLENFFAVVQDDEFIGTIGMEIYGRYGLLRSLAVTPAYRNQGIAEMLLNRLEVLAPFKNVTTIYLLTETASDYFINKGYMQVSRFDVPEEVQQSSEFSYVCPQSATVMKKQLSIT